MKSKQKPLKIIQSKTGVQVEYIYCRRCMKDKRPIHFWAAVDFEIDRNGFMSVCTDCCNEMFDGLIAQGNAIELAVLRMCQKLNMKYDESAIESAKKQMETYRETGKTLPPFLSIYKIKLVTTQNNSFQEMGGSDLTYKEVTTINVSQDQNTIDKHNKEEIEEAVIDFWGEGMETKDYAWLERRLANWKRTHKSDTQAEEALLREIVFKEFEIKVAREGKKPVTSAMLRDLQDLMKTSAVDPSKSNAAMSGKSQDAFSAFIKMIEENRPAEYYQDKLLFEDFDNIGEKYFKPYVTRPMKNFITGSRDFSLEDSNDEEDDEFSDVSIDTAIGEESESEV